MEVELARSRNLGYDVYIYDRSPLTYCKLGENGRFVFYKCVNEDELLEPTFTIPDRFIIDGTLQNLADALCNMGIRTNKDVKLEGTLEATRYHLEDLRTLLKLKNG